MHLFQATSIQTHHCCFISLAFSKACWQVFAGLRVLVVEKGGWVRSADMQWMEREACKIMYENACMLATEDGTVNVMAGATLGGGTKVNWAAALRTPEHVRKVRWAGLPPRQ